MPNWCDNVVVVTGDADSLDKFVQAAQSPVDNTDLSLEMLHPMPDSVTKGEPITLANGAVVQTMSDAEYRWCVDNWGTKWDVEATIGRKSDECVEYYFASAWAPPVEAFRKIAKDYPTLDFTMKYAEPGMAFAGATHFSEGELMYDDCMDFDDYDDWVNEAHMLGFESAMYEWELYGYDCREDYEEALAKNEV